jgi:hypothetical protein
VKANEAVLTAVHIAPPQVDAAKLLLPASVPPMPLPKVAQPELVAATAQIPDLSLLKDTNPPEPSREPAEPPKTEPPPVTLEKLQERPATEFSPLASRGPDQRNLLALTPMPASPERLVVVPPGEARGLFAIAPEPNLAASEPEPGSKPDVSPPAAGVSPTKTPAGGNAAAGKPAPVVTVTFGASAGGAKEKGSSGGGTGANTPPGSRAGSGPGPGVGSGSGAGPGTGTGPGSGAGSGPGKGPFTGITIVGGVRETGAAAKSASPARTPRPLQTSYGLNIVSTEGSGGGLPFFGVFSHEQIYTVYLDMRRTETDSAPSWTLEFAVSQETAAQANAADSPGRSQQGLVLPFPAVKEQPVLPAELVRKYLGRMVIVYAIINIEGKMEQMSVKDSPDALLNEAVLSTLGKWVFRPAQLNGTPVPAKVLLGIPLWLPE